MISTYFEQRNWANGEAERVARLMRFWQIQRIRVQRAIERAERESKWK
jgi:hypothetical protein